MFEVEEQIAGYCPLSYVAGRYMPCKGKKCAWWSDKEQKCSILMIAENLYNLYKAYSREP